ITATPSQITVGPGMTQQEVTVSVQFDTIQCWNGPGGVSAVDDSNNYVASFSIVGYVYSPKIVGRISLISDTFYFGHVVVEANDSEWLDVPVDTFGCIFRTLIPLNIRPPFSCADSITPEYCQFLTQNDYFHFHPTAIGHYIDTTFLYDPIRKDSTMLILLGEGVAAGVSPNAAEANSLRINPNPCDRSAAISLSGGDIEDITVRNILGECVLESRMGTSGIFNLNTSELPAGIYFVEVRSRHGRYWQRIVVSH
ncbi:MAG: T9SS type A sorting domain-containing protein, partial [Candidatus Kapaibacterium sp.]